MITPSVASALGVPDLFHSTSLIWKVLAISGWRRLVFLSEFADSVILEGKYASLKTDADKLMAALREHGLQDNNINDTTQKRYLALGRRVELHKSMLMRWELYHARDTLVDQITTMRLICSISDREEDVGYILNELFLQQRAGLRHSLVVPKSKGDVKTPQNVGKGMLIKRMVLNHLIEKCPNLKPTLEPFADHTHYELRYGVRTNGEKTRELKDDEDDDQDIACGHELRPPTINQNSL